MAPSSRCRHVVVTRGRLLGLALALAVSGVAPGTAAAAADAGAGLFAEVPYAVDPGPAPAPVSLATPWSGLLEQRATADERGYYATVLARVDAALRRATQPTGYSCAFEPPPPPPDVALMRPRRLGWSPASWHDLQVRCRRAGAPELWLGVDVDTVQRLPYWCTPRLVAGVAGVVRCDAVQGVRSTSFFFGEGRAFKAADPLLVSRGPATARGIELVAMDAADAVAPFLERLDLSPLAELARAPPALPRQRVKSPAGPELPPDERAAAKAAVYRAVLSELGAGDAVRVVVLAQRPGSRPPAPLFQAMERVAVELDPSAVADFKSATGSETPFPADAGVPVELITMREVSEMFHVDGGEDGWARLRRRFPGTRALVTLSAVGLSKDGSSAIVEVRVQGGPLAGGAGIWFLSHGATGWRLAYRYGLWVS